MPFEFSVPTPAGNCTFQVYPGSSLLFVGANGGGKTRLAVAIEQALHERAHRVSAHRALTLSPEVPKISEAEALRGLRIGTSDKETTINHRNGSRWKRNAAVSLLNDYDFLIQCLFADQANVSLLSHQKARAGSKSLPEPTKFEKLIEVWNRVLPHRSLRITGDDIKASVSGAEDSYSATDMSDGERAVFYLIGQTLAADDNSLLIFDEPELHIHRSIMSRLWDELDALRPDCATVLISHDLEFVASRTGQKFVIREYKPANGWTVEPVPEDTGFTEEMTTLILGSRKPILFVEGGRSSLDIAVYRSCYPEWTIVPRGSCEQVIHAVTTLRANSSFTRVTCAGIVDADDYKTTEIDFMTEKGIAVLPFSEIENLFMHPRVLRAVMMLEGFSSDEAEAREAQLFDELFQRAENKKQQREVIVRYCRRRIDRTLKKVDLSDAENVDALDAIYASKTGSLNVKEIAAVATASIQGAISRRDVATLLKWYDDKGMLGIACKAKGTTKTQFESWVVRALRNNNAPGVSEEIKHLLPTVRASS